MALPFFAGDFLAGAYSFTSFLTSLFTYALGSPLFLPFFASFLIGFVFFAGDALAFATLGILAGFGAFSAFLEGAVGAFLGVDWDLPFLGFDFEGSFGSAAFFSALGLAAGLGLSFYFSFSYSLFFFFSYSLYFFFASASACFFFLFS